MGGGTGTTSILLPENWFFQLFLSPRLSAADSRCKLGSWKMRSPPAFRAGRRGGGPAAQWQIMQILAEHGIRQGAARAMRLISELASSPSIPPSAEWHQSGSESLKVCGLMSGRDRPLLPIAALRSRLAAPGDRGDGGDSGTRERGRTARAAAAPCLSPEFSQAFCRSRQAPRLNPRVQEGSCILNGVPSRGLNHCSRLLALKRTGWVQMRCDCAGRVRWLGLEQEEPSWDAAQTAAGN